MLSPIKTKRERQRITVYDLEWLPGTYKNGLPLRIVGAYDERGYRSFQTAEAFLDWALTQANNGRRFYAHAGGLADILFLLQHFIARDYECSGVSSGSSLIILVVKRGRNTWLFVDSYWTLRSGLADVGTSLGKFPDGTTAEKGDCAFDAPLPELETYNRQDCKILWHALRRMEDELWELGGELKCTLASSAMNLFRRAYLPTTLYVPGNVNDTLRDGYFGGRVEVYQRHVETRGYYYDINSSYPHSMSKKLPGSYTGSSRKIRPYSWVFATVRTDGYCPALPYKSDALYFPTGKFSGWFYVDELEQSGVEILEVDQVMHFSPQEFMAPYVSELFGRRKTSTDEFARLCYKLLLNSLYGKLGERTEKSKIIIKPSREWLLESREIAKREIAHGLPESRPMLMPGVYLEACSVEVPHEHVALCSAVTAHSRINLRRYMTSTPTIYYCDTDSIVTNDPALPTSKELGGLKQEKAFDAASFPAPKIYMIDDELKCKGFPRKAIAEAMSYEPLLAMSEGRAIDPAYPLDAIVREIETRPDAHPFSASPTLRKEIFRRILEQGRDPQAPGFRFRSMDRVGTQLRYPSGKDAKGDAIPIAVEHERVKRFRNITRPKRCDLPNGNTRAWDVSELSDD